MKETSRSNKPNYTPLHNQASVFASKSPKFVFPKKIFFSLLVVFIVVFLSYVALRMAVKKQVLSYNKQSASPTPSEPEITDAETPTDEPTPTYYLGGVKKNVPTPTKSAGGPTSIPPANPTNPPNTPVPTDVPPTGVPTATPTPLPPDVTPPTITSMGGPDNGATINTNSFCFPMTITDDQSQAPNIWTQYQFDTGTWTDWNNDQQTAYSPCFSGIHDGEHIFAVHAKDAAGNVSSTLSRDFKVTTNSR